MRLQMCRKDIAFAFHYSSDGRHFYMTRFFTLPVGDTDRRHRPARSSC